MKQFAFQKGILFSASHFSDIKNRWGIAFTIWKSGSTDDKNDTDVYLLSSASSTANGISIFPENFKKIVSNFAARKLITGKYVTWLNDKDEYCVPNIEHPSYQEWNNNAIIYALFHSSSQQSSLRQITYKGELYKTIPNEFFFMSVNEIKILANEAGNEATYYDCLYDSKERYVYQLLLNTQLSAEADQVLEVVKEIIKTSFCYRDKFNQENPKYNIYAWDAGWYQIKALLNYYNKKEELKKFNLKYKILEDKMRPLVYKLGFLR